MTSDKKIIMALGERQKLARDFGVSLPTVRSALNGITHSTLAEQIREEALRRGGAIYQKVEATPPTDKNQHPDPDLNGKT